MPYPLNGTERARPDLADSLFAYDVLANQNRMVAFDVFPLREVAEYKGIFGRVTAKELLKRPVATAAKPAGYAYLRAPRSAYPTDDMAFTDDTYETLEFGLENVVDQNEARSYRSYFEFETIVTQRINNLLMSDTELRVASACFDTTVFTTGANKRTIVSGGEQWHNPTTATPIKHVKTAQLAIYNNSGVWPDSIVMNQIAFLHLIHCDEIRARTHAQGAGSPDRAAQMNIDLIAQILNVPNVIVAGGTYDSNNANKSFAPAQIWGPHAMVFKRSNSRDLREIGLGRSFHWALDDSMPTGYVEDYYEPQVRGTKIRVRHQMHNKLVYSDVGYLLSDVYA